MQETWAWFLGWDDPLEKEVTTHSSILAWRIPWTEKPGRLNSLCGCKTVYVVAKQSMWLQNSLCGCKTVYVVTELLTLWLFLATLKPVCCASCLLILFRHQSLCLSPTRLISFLGDVECLRSIALTRLLLGYPCTDSYLTGYFCHSGISQALYVHKKPSKTTWSRIWHIQFYF